MAPGSNPKKRPGHMRVLASLGIAAIIPENRRGESNAAGRFGQSTVLGNGFHRACHPELEHLLLIVLDILGEFPDRRHDTE